MNVFLHILPVILCFALLIPTVSADEIPETGVPTESTAETVWEPYTESLYLGDYEEPAAETETQTEAATEGETEPTETIPLIPEETNDAEQNALLAELSLLHEVTFCAILIKKAQRNGILWIFPILIIKRLFALLQIFTMII